MKMTVKKGKEIVKLYQWIEYGHDPIGYQRWEEEISQDTRAPCKANKGLLMLNMSSFPQM